MSDFFLRRSFDDEFLRRRTRLAQAVKLRLGVVGAVIGGPPVASLFISTPQSNLRFASSPAGEPFSLPPTKSCPRKRGKCRGVAVTKGERLGDAEHCEMFPLSLFAIAHRQLPRKRWRLLVRFTNSHVKPALKGEVDASVTSRRRGYKAAHSSLFVTTPQSIRLTAYCQLPVRGAF